MAEELDKTSENKPERDEKGIARTLYRKKDKIKK